MARNSINSFRSSLYGLARVLGWVQAINQSTRRGSLTPLLKRAGRVYAGRASGSLINKLFPPGR